MKLLLIPGLLLSDCWHSQVQVSCPFLIAPLSLSRTLIGYGAIKRADIRRVHPILV